MSVVGVRYVAPTAVSSILWRIVVGAGHNFPLRVSDWFASLVMLSFGLVLLAWPEAFSTYVFYVLLGKLGTVGMWGVSCVTIGLLRLAALIVNGTFPSFRFSPHLRFLMALLSCFIWFQIVLGLLSAGVPTTAFAVYPQLFLFDLYNTYLAASEAGVAERRFRNGSW